MIEELVDVPRRWLAAALAVVVLALVVTVLAEGSVQQPGGRFSAERALVHLGRIADAPRPLGSPASDRARDYAAGQLREAGFDVEVQQAVGARTASGLATFGRVDNVVATRRGHDSTGAVLLVAHYDSAAIGPGASDDGAAVAAVLDVVRQVGRLRNDLVVLLTDGEEDGILGAEAFAREHPLARKGGVVLNWEARGVGGPVLLFETSPGNAELVSLFADAVPHPRGDSSMVEIYRALPNNSDFSALAGAGFVGLNSAFIEGASRYHTADDTVGHLDPGSLQHVGETMLHLAEALGDRDLRTIRADHDATYFRVFGVLVTYSDALVWPIAVLALVAALALAVRRPVRSLVAAVSVVVPLGVSAVLGQVLWAVLVWVRPGYDAMGGLLHRPAAYQAAVVALAGFAVLGWYVVLRRALGTALVSGALLALAVLGVVCAGLAPGASFLFALPALAGAVGVLAARLPVRWRWWPVATVTAGAVVSTALLPVLARNVANGMGLALAGVGAVAVALYLVTLLPLIEPVLPRVAPLVALGLAVVLAAVGVAVDRFDAGHPERSHLAYVLDADTGVASWVSGDAEPTEWTRRHVSGRDTASLPPGYARGPLWTGRAPVLSHAGPEVVVRERSGDSVTLRVRSPRGASGLVLRVDHGIASASASVPGRGPVAVAVSGTRAGTWPGEVRFRDLPAEGVDITLRTPGASSARVTAIDETHGLPTAATPRPAGVVASTREDGDLVAVARTYLV